PQGRRRRRPRRAHGGPLGALAGADAAGLSPRDDRALVPRGARGGRPRDRRRRAPRAPRAPRRRGARQRARPQDHRGRRPRARRSAFHARRMTREPRGVPFWSPAEVEAAIPATLAYLERRGVLAYPTETVYGFGGAICGASVGRPLGANA